MESREITVSPEVLAYARAIIDQVASGKALDPEAVRRVRECSVQIREQTFQNFGFLDIGVPAIRELREGE